MAKVPPPRLPPKLSRNVRSCANSPRRGPHGRFWGGNSNAARSPDRRSEDVGDSISGKHDLGRRRFNVGNRVTATRCHWPLTTSPATEKAVPAAACQCDFPRHASRTSWWNTIVPAIAGFTSRVSNHTACLVPSSTKGSHLAVSEAKIPPTRPRANRHGVAHALDRGILGSHGTPEA